MLDLWNICIYIYNRFQGEIYGNIWEYGNVTGTDPGVIERRYGKSSSPEKNPERWFMGT